MYITLVYWFRRRWKYFQGCRKYGLEKRYILLSDRDIKFKHRSTRQYADSFKRAKHQRDAEALWQFVTLCHNSAKRLSSCVLWQQTFRFPRSSYMEFLPGLYLSNPEKNRSCRWNGWDTKKSSLKSAKRWFGDSIDDETSLRPDQYWIQPQAHNATLWEDKEWWPLAKRSYVCTI